MSEELPSEPEESERIYIEGHPYFIVQNDQGLFVAVEYLLVHDGWYEDGTYDDVGQLGGVDIVETPNRGIKLHFENPECNSFDGIRYALGVLRGEAQVSNHEFYSYEPVGGNEFYFTVGRKGESDICYVVPRLFRQVR